ncbi:hypothetical protein SAMN04488029_0069 [Reichenbachiella faecimaris]|uniref:Uncharacterized protein n=1 Tax=Reichenbachiella faecimaris TaxID=692418 RepID=A0A1W2G5C3_REIFA|nr:hypothetical protein SAMN04488029_0069 [Reichenbachiella faecimaris]
MQLQNKKSLLKTGTASISLEIMKRHTSDTYGFLYQSTLSIKYINSIFD